jgi:flagellar protein FliO/FliZ
MVRWIFGFILLWSSPIWSQETSIGEAVIQPSDYFGQILISLIFVLLIIFVSAWLLRRFGRVSGVANGNLKVLGALSVGQRERILLIQAGKEQLVVGVTSNQISTLHTLSEPVKNEAELMQGFENSFANKLKSAIQQRQKKPMDLKDDPNV